MPTRPVLPAGPASGRRPGGAGAAAPPASDGRRILLGRRIRLLVAATITYNAIEAVVALAAGTVASSGALLAFGLDSVVEVLSAAAVAWQFAGPDPEAREPKALRFIAFSFFGLAAFVTIDAARALAGGGEAQHSPVGIALAAASLVVMPFLSLAQRRAGRELGSRSAVADSKQTLLCTYLSAVLLGGLLLNSTLGWSWADPVAALIIAAVAVKEGREAWKGDACCAPPMASATPAAAAATSAAAAATPAVAAAAATPAVAVSFGQGEGPVPPAPATPSCSCCSGRPTEPSE